ncbi:MAG: FtsX-like permease family protein [Nitrospiraceae bacterium]|nr:MAG: FtsX-like permease family protein [Nitrospiraceae bacterium]
MLMIFLKEVRHRWMIHLLVVFLMAFVISVLVVQSSLNSSAEEKIDELSHDLGKGMLVLPRGVDLESYYAMRYGPEVMPDDYDDRLKASPLGRHAGRIEAMLYGNITVQGRGLVLAGRKVKGSGPAVPGREPVTLGGGVARELGLRPGDTLVVGGRSLQVSRIMDTPPKGHDMTLFVPLRTAQEILEKPGKINAITLGGCWCKLDVPAFAASVENTLPGTRAITVDGLAKAQTEINALMERYSLLLWIVCAALAIGSVVFLILYMLRKGEREIGLLLSIGISPWRIILKNVTIGVITAVAGALVGHMLSVPLMSWFGQAVMGIALVPSMGYLPHFVTAGAAVALMASSLPTWLATRLDPTKLLREE